MTTSVSLCKISSCGLRQGTGVETQKINQLPENLNHMNDHYYHSYDYHHYHYYCSNNSNLSGAFVTELMSWWLLVDRFSRLLTATNILSTEAEQSFSSIS